MAWNPITLQLAVLTVEAEIIIFQQHLPKKSLLEWVKKRSIPPVISEFGTSSPFPLDMSKPEILILGSGGYLCSFGRWSITVQHLVSNLLL